MRGDARARINREDDDMGIAPMNRPAVPLASVHKIG
jgi:hypothetical protein